MSVAEFTRPKRGQFVLVELVLPGQRPEIAGVFLLDPEANELHVRMRRDLDLLTDDEDQLEVLEPLADDLDRKAKELGGSLLDVLADHSNFLRITDREAVTIAGSPHLTINDLYRSNVRPRVLPFRTHLPVFYSLRAAAGSFSPERSAAEEPEDWLEAPPDLRLRENMFVARVEGRSMEPKIPDGSLVIFRSNPAGSRQGKILLVERVSHYGSEVTVKVYQSTKIQDADGQWRHDQITMVPLNSEFPSWTLQEGERLNVIAEFVDIYS
jgi:SOS-response transcriptional repressor LexA